MKVLLALFLFFISSLFPVSSKDKITSKFICSYFGEPIDGDEILVSFSSNNEAEKIINAIIDVVGLKPNFTIRSAKIPNAAAVVLKGERYILYNPDFIGKLDKITKSRWASISILAHETGHHLNGHTLSSGGSRPDIELEADEFSGFVLRKMGATLAESQLAMKIAASQKASHTHPARASRLIAIEKGWKHADVQMSGKRSAEIEKMSEPDQSAEIDPVEKQNILERKYIKYEVNFNFDPEGIYFVTVKNNVVRIVNNQIQVIAKFTASKNKTFPYVLYQSDKNYLFVNKSGIIMTAKGERAGYLREPT